MANSILTPVAVTREALSVLHQNLTFVGSMNRQYDASFARSGGKIGSQLKIRLPNEFTVRTGLVADVQHISEISETLTVGTVKGIDVEFGHDELALSMDDFSERVLQPAMPRLAAAIEADCLSMYKDVYNEISDVGAAITFDDLLAVNELLAKNLVPDGAGMLAFHLQPRDNRNLVSELKGLFHPAANISDNYRKGVIGDAAGFRFYQNTLLPIHTTGTDDGTGDYLVNQTSVTEGATSITVDTGAGTWKKGDVFHFANVYRVHPETKTTTGDLMRFVVAADVSASATTITFSPALYSTGARQNVNAMPANNAALFKLESDGSTAIGNAADYTISLAHHRDAFTFATADLPLPSDAAFAARQVMDGISMRIWKASDWTNSSEKCRIDVLYGYKTIRPQWAVRAGFN